MFRKVSVGYLAAILDTDARTFHREIKPFIIKDNEEFLSKVAYSNPDIGLDDDGKIYLVNPQDNKEYIETDRNIQDYK